MATPHGDDEPGCSRKRARHQQTDVELIDLEDMELEQSQHGLFPSIEEPCLPAWAKKRTNLWVKDATEFLFFEPNNVGANEDSDIVQKSQADTHTQADEFCVNIPLQRMLHSYADYREKCVICYHKSRVLQNADMEQWMHSHDAFCDAVEQVWQLGQGFFAIKFAAKSVAEKVLLDGEMPFNEGHVHVVPYIPCFFPFENAKKIWPVWVSFPCLPLFLKPFLKEIASGLGKVVHVLQPSCVISPVSPRVCILWDAQKKVPDNVRVSFDQLGTMKLAVAFDMRGVATAASQEHENGEEKGEPLALLLPAEDVNGEVSEKKGPLPLSVLVLASSDKEPLPSPQKATTCISPPPHVKGPEPAKARPLKEIKGPIITSPVPTLLGKGILKCPIASPTQVHSLSSGACLMADGHGAQWASGREALTTYNNALYQHKKSKSSGKELAVLASQHHAMKVSSNSQVKHTTDSKTNASKYVYSYPGKESNGTKKDPKFDKENIVTRKDSKDEEKSMNKKDHKLVSGHTDNCSFQSPEALTSSPKPYYLSPLPYGTPPTS